MSKTTALLAGLGLAIAIAAPIDGAYAQRGGEPQQDPNQPPKEKREKGDAPKGGEQPRGGGDRGAKPAQQQPGATRHHPRAQLKRNVVAVSSVAKVLPRENSAAARLRFSVRLRPTGRPCKHRRSNRHRHNSVRRRPSVRRRLIGRRRLIVRL